MTKWSNLKTFTLAALIAIGFAVQASLTRAADTEKMAVAGSCFWCVEAGFEKVKGVKEAVSGFVGSTTAQPHLKSLRAR